MLQVETGHFAKLRLEDISEVIEAEPRVECFDYEVKMILDDVNHAVDNKNYIPPTPTEENPALSDDYIFDTEDVNLILQDLNCDNFVAKILDLSKGAKKRKAKGYPQEYLYVFKYACRLSRLDVNTSGVEYDKVLIYIKINSRKIPINKVYIVSFHKNNVKW